MFPKYGVISYKHNWASSVELALVLNEDIIKLHENGKYEIIKHHDLVRSLDENAKVLFEDENAEVGK